MGLARLLDCVCYPSGLQNATPLGCKTLPMGCKMLPPWVENATPMGSEAISVVNSVFLEGQTGGFQHSILEHSAQHIGALGTAYWSTRRSILEHSAQHIRLCSIKALRGFE